MLHLGRSPGLNLEARPVVAPDAANTSPVRDGGDVATTPHIHVPGTTAEGEARRNPGALRPDHQDLAGHAAVNTLAPGIQPPAPRNLLSILIDPEKMLRSGPPGELAQQAIDLALEEEDRHRIEVCIGSKPAHRRPKIPQRSILTVHDEEVAKRLCRRINSERWTEIFDRMIDALLAARHKQEQKWRARNAALKTTWYTEPWYCLDPRFFSTPESGRIARLEDTAHGLDYVSELGFQNLLLLQHYETDWLTGGHGVVSYVTSKVLGGDDAFRRFMERSYERQIRVVTAAAINHTSVHHTWFQKALEGDRDRVAYYYDATHMQRLGEVESGGQVFCHYHDTEGRRSIRRFLEPDFLPHDHLVAANCGGESRMFYSSVRPFQADLDLRNPEVLSELFQILGQEVSEGVIGKYMDSVAYWMKKPGTTAFAIEDTHSLLGLIKLYLRLIGGREVAIPSVVGDTATEARFLGRESQIHDVPTSSEGDAFLWAKGSMALRESIYLKDRTPIEALVRGMPRLPPTTTAIAYLENQDEIPLELASTPTNRQKLAEYIRAHGGEVFKLGLAAGCRHADCLDHDPRRIAMSFFCLYMMPATPMIYFGTEIGARNNVPHARLMRKWRHEYYRRMGIDTPESSCHDPSALQRGPVPADTIRAALVSNYPVLAVVRKLNQLWATIPALRSRQVHVIDHAHPGVLAWMKRDQGDRSPPVLMVANLSERVAEIELPSVVHEALSPTRGSDLGSLVDLMASEPTNDLTAKEQAGERDVSIDRRRRLRLRVRPFGFQLLSTRSNLPT